MDQGMMESRERVRRMLRHLIRRLRLVRGTAAGLRFLVVGLGLAVVPLLLKGVFPAARQATWVAAALAAGSFLLGFLYGVAAPLSPSRAARLADRRLGLKERLSAAEEHLRLPSPSPIAQAQVDETASRLSTVRARQAFPFRSPREAPLLAPLAMAVVALVLLPALPLRLPDLSAGADQQAAATEESVEKPLEQKLTTPAMPETLLPKGTEKEIQRGPLSPRTQQGDLAAVFKDTKVSEKRPDFGSFVKQGDDRMKLLGKPESIPDLSRDVTESPYQVMVRRMQEQLRAGRLQGLSWEQLERLLSELGENQQRAGGEGLPDDLLNELGQQGQGSQDKMMSALSRALNRLRDKGQQGQGKGRGLKEAPADGRGGEGQGEGEEGKGDGTPGGSKPGTEKSLQTKGDPTERIPSEKQDAALEGETREGRMESYDTNLSGPGAENRSRLPYLSVYSQYRRMMEEALTKEPIPFNYREQVKEYFQSLERR